jgi:hypothetical protein
MIYVPTLEGKKIGRSILHRVRSAWAPPSHFFHFRPGGHVEAARLHIRNSVFARLDISAFFDSVTRTKIFRSLRAIHISKEDALEISTLSTVAKNVGNRSLPFGFVQSPILASLALDKSALGQSFYHIKANGNVIVSVYMDDIIISGNSVEEVNKTVELLHEAARLANFSLKNAKEQVASSKIYAFNLSLSHILLEVTEERMRIFRQTLEGSSRSKFTAVVNYVAGVNIAQAARLLTECPLDGPT